MFPFSLCMMSLCIIQYNWRIFIHPLHSEVNQSNNQSNKQHGAIPLEDKHKLVSHKLQHAVFLLYKPC